MTVATLGFEVCAAGGSARAKMSLRKPRPRAATVFERRCSRLAGMFECTGNGLPSTVGLRAETATTEKTMAGLRMISWVEGLEMSDKARVGE